MTLDPAEQEAAAAAPRSTLATYRLLAASLDDTDDGGCDLIFANDEEALAFAATMAEGAGCIQVWDASRLVGLIYAPPPPGEPEPASDT